MFGRRWVVAVAVLVTVAACGSDDDATSSTPPTAAPPTASTRVDAATTTSAASVPTSGAPPASEPDATEPPATDAPTATPDDVPPTITAGPTTTTPGITVGFDPPCVEQPAAGAPIDTSLDADLATFGPLGVTPGLTINLPLGHGDGEVGATSASVLRIPGGLLVRVTASSPGFDGTIVAAVDLDGSKRWVRCFDATVTALVAGADSEPSHGLVSAARFAGGTVTYDWQAISLTDGTTSGAPAGRAGMGWVFASGGDSILFAPGDTHVVVEATDRLVRLDLATLTTSTVRYPPGSDGQQVFSLSSSASEDGRIFITEPGGAGMPDLVTAVLVGDEWSTAPADLRTARPIMIDFPVEGDPTARALDATGGVIWERADIASVGGEGFRYAIDGDVAVVAGCTPSGRGPTDPCADDGALYGLDIETGETLWRSAGPRGVGPIGNGYALVTEVFERSTTAAPIPLNWLMIDTATGEPIEGQEWPAPFSFGTECCGGYDTAHTDLLDGLVAAVHGTQAFIWFPAELTPRIPPVVAIP